VFDGTFLGKDGAGIPVEVVLDGMGIQESFFSDATGRIAIALPLGEYKATIKSEGYTAKDVVFTMTEQGAIVSETLVAGGSLPAIAETPLISGNKYRVRVRKGPYFDGDALDIAKSAEALDQLAVYMSQHPEYGKIEIRVHTDDRGNPSKRSQARADAIMSYLVSKGVPAARLEAKGWGDKDPVAVNITADGRRKNNRTEFKAKDYDASKVPAGAASSGGDED
jgi:outer membrane protein OmpA-like peptidoglycan-associated protein